MCKGSRQKTLIPRLHDVRTASVRQVTREQQPDRRRQDDLKQRIGRQCIVTMYSNGVSD